MTETLGERLLRIKEERGISYRKIADAAGTGETAVRDIVVGRSASPKLSTLVKIADALGVGVTELVGEDPRLAEPSRAPSQPYIRISDSIDDARDALDLVKADPEVNRNPAVRNLVGKHARLLAEVAAALNAPSPTGGIGELSGVEYAFIPRYDAAMSAGPGSIIDPHAEPIGFHPVEAQWLRALTHSAPSHLAVLRVDGDSMEDTLHDGDWVLVDRGETRAKRGGVFALQVDDATWVKRLTLNLKDRLIQVISDNPRYPVQELREDSLSVIGRVVWIVARKL